MASVTALEEQQEKLRRLVDTWRGKSHNLLRNLHHGSYSSSYEYDSSSLNSDPVCVSIEPFEHSDVLTLIGSENVAMSKFITVLSFDCIEISRLSRHASRNIYKQLLLFSHRPSSQDILFEGEPQKAFGHSLSLFMELCEVTHQMSIVLVNLLQQLHSIYSLQDNNVRPFKSFKNLKIRTVLTSLGDGLALCLILDEIFRQNDHIKGYLSLFSRMLNDVKMDNDKFGILVEDLHCLDEVVRHLEKVLNVGMLQHLFEEASFRDTLQRIKCNRKFFDACTSCCHDGLSDIISRLDTWKEMPSDRRKILNYFALVLFGAYAWDEVPEKRVGKVIKEMLQLVPVIYVEGGLRFMLLELLRNHFPPSLLSWSTFTEAARDWGSIKGNYLIHLNEVLSRDTDSIRDDLASWVASFQSTIHPLTELSRVEPCLRLHADQILQGILLANKMRKIVISMLDLHPLLEVPIRREKLKSLCYMVVLLKVAESTFLNKGLDIILSLPHMLHFIQSDIEKLLLPVKAELMTEISKGNPISKIRFLSSFAHGGQDVDARLKDSLSLVSLSLELLQGGCSHKRQLILSIVHDAIESIGHPAINHLKIKKLLCKAEIITNYQSLIKEITDCSFLFGKTEMIGTWLSMIYSDVNKFSWLQHLLNAFCDVLWRMKLANVGKLTLQFYEEEIENAVKKEILSPLCKDIETDLRLHVHSANLKGSMHVNLTKTGVRNLSWCLQMKPLQLPFKSIDIKLYVETYLNRAFYDHTAMSSYNWKIYSEMRHLAELKYGLILDDIHLPEHSPDQSLNLIDTIQNLQKFATSYSYNIYNQGFVEKISKVQARKTLRIFSVEHAASSVATYGLGAFSTATTCASEFVIQKFASLSELLVGSSVKSRLIEEFKDRKRNGEAISKYILLKTEEPNIAKSKPHFAENELSFLGELCSVVTEMGNILGFLRTLFTGRFRHTSNISRFLCRPTNIKSFMEHSQKLDLSDETIKAGRIMDIAMENKHQPEEQKNSFSSLIAALRQELQSHEYPPFKDFFFLVPLAIICFMGSKVSSKDKMLRMGRAEGRQVAVEDGFMMGMAFVLKVIGQDESFDELQWFASVNEHFEEVLSLMEGSRVTGQQKGRGLVGWKFWSQATTTLILPETQKDIDKIKGYKSEMELIQYGINVSRTIMS
ncbi:uncharacterized protein [Aristolochia californica]|uniref:uncharacterized protein n=1 Tax=Aristolochia californica TaxID=171875 RepID=UPI0035DF5670